MRQKMNTREPLFRLSDVQAGFEMLRQQQVQEIRFDGAERVVVGRFFFEGVKKATSPPLLFDFLDLHNTNEKYSMTNCSRIVASCQVARPSFNAFKIERSLPSWELTSPPTMALLFEDSMIFRTSRLGE